MIEPRKIRRLAIVNRGEAAMRCIRAVKSLRVLEGSDIEVMALYTEPDRDAPFVRHADISVLLPSAGGAVAAYLDHDSLLASLRKWRADAVWPGWGFVAEDPVFVERLASEGIVFLGPSADAMRSLGDKITSKKLAEKAGVPVTSWSGGSLDDEAAALRESALVGYPVVVKATAGGGGRGIRIVHKEEDLVEAYRSASSEAAAAFGNGDLFCEKLVSGGRHIEVQIAADQHGNVISVGCRDCSVQRRHQKVLEEAPPPGLAPKVRESLESAAIQMARFVSYVGVGTVEFLLGDEDFYFLEVNPRLQVEHGITEEITGIDLVQLQIRIARGESIKDVVIEERGVAIEARICAEDPDQGFLPSPGPITRFDPALGPRVRVDSGVTTGTVVSSDFDSLIAKVIATGDNREEAQARLACALRDFELVVEGGATNKGYLLELLGAEAYRAGPVDTSWVDRWNETRSEQRVGDSEEVQDAFVAAAIVAYQRNRSERRAIFYSDAAALSRERIPPNDGQQFDLTYEGESYRLIVYAIGNWRYRVHLDGQVVAATMREEGAHRARLIIDERVRRIVYDSSSELGIRLELEGVPHRYGLQTAGQVRSGSPAMVVAIQVAEGDRVHAGQPIGLLEAMKMEIGFQAPISGVVSEVMVRSGQQVAAGEVLLVIDPGSEDGAEVTASVRVALPRQLDPLALLFRGSDEDPLAEPDLEAANAADLSERRVAIDIVREEIRRALLGFDTNPQRTERLVAFLEAPLPDDLSESFRRELAEIRHELSTFADIEQIFIRAPQASVSGGAGPSNDARFRMYVRRLRASGAGVADEFLDLVRAALIHYGISDLKPSDALERAVLRLLTAQLNPKLRYRLVLGVLRRINALANAGIEMDDDRPLALALARIAPMRPQVSDGVADAALEASYLVYLQPGVEARADRTSQSVNKWLSSSETELTVPPTGVLLEVAAAPRRVFDRVGQWLTGEDPARREIALAAHTQRRYAPRVPLGYRTATVDGRRIHCVEYPGIGVVLAASALASEVVETVEQITRAARHLRDRELETPLYAMELVVPPGGEIEFDDVRDEIERLLGEKAIGCRFTLGVLGEEGGMDHLFKTWVPVSGGMVLRSAFYDLHPETAERIDIDRYTNFELERIPAEEGVYTFYGKSKDVPGDERFFVLADARDRAPSAGHELANHLPTFERVFNRAARSLRSILQIRDPRRRLQWNRIAIFVAPSIFLDTDSVEGIARRLAPAVRHLGIEKVLVRMNLLDRERPDEPPTSIEVEIIDTRDQMEIGTRAPHHEPLQPAQDYERRVVAARRARLPYAYETIKMLTSGERNLVDQGRDRSGAQLPQGTFEEYDLDSETKEALSVAGRPYGANVAGVVFGLISTPTEKLPEGMRRVLVLSDATMGMGALAVPECDRLVAAFDLAERLELPLEWVAVSSGARIAMDSGTENLDATARVVRRIVTFTQADGIVNVIVAGVNIGAQAYFDALATMLMHTKGALIMTQNASMVLTGRRALEAAGSVSAEDELAIGGYERIMGPNGEAQYYAHNLAEAYRILYEHYRYCYVEPGEAGPRRFRSEDPSSRSICDHPITGEETFGFASVGEIFDDATNPGRKRPFGMRSVMEAVADQDGGHLERWNALFGGETAIVWDAHLGGIPIQLIGIESHTVTRDGYRPYDGPEDWNGGTLFPHSSKKVARAINAASGIRPVVILANLSGFDGSPESLRKMQLEYGAEIARAVVNFQGPMLFNVVSRYHGGAYVVFSQELNPNLEATALEGSYASVIGGGPAASVVFAREVRGRALTDPRVEAKERSQQLRPTPEGREELDALVREVMLEKQAQVAAEFDSIHSVERARDVGSLSGIIDPRKLRADLIASLEAALGSGRG